MPLAVPLVAPLTVKVSPSPGNEPSVILTSAPLRTVSSVSVSVTAGESNTAALFSWNVAFVTTENVGASSTATTLTSEIAGWLSFTPSLTTTSMMRSPQPECRQPS